MPAISKQKLWWFHTEHIRQPACPCWKALSLFLNREGSTKSQPRASSANSFLRSGSCRKEISFILMLLSANGASVADSTHSGVRIILLSDYPATGHSSACLYQSTSCSPQPCSSLNHSPACCSTHPIVAGRGQSPILKSQIGRVFVWEQWSWGGVEMDLPFSVSIPQLS